MSYTQIDEIAGASYSDSAAQSKRRQECAGVPIEIGKLYLNGDRLVSLRAALFDGYVRVRDEATGVESTITPGQLRSRPVEMDTDYYPASVDLSDEDKNHALKKYKHLERLVRVQKFQRTEAMLTVAALGAARSVRTIRKWLADFDAGGLRALAPLKRGRPTGSLGVDSRVESIVLQVIRSELQTKPGITVKDLMPRIEQLCDELNNSLSVHDHVRYPGEATVGRRLRVERENYKNHHGQTRRHIKESHRATPGGLKASRPLERVEIDHTLMDVHVVDDATLESIGRPWITMAIDVFSRCVLGFVLLMTRPSHLSLALCMQHIRYPKQAWLRAVGSPVEWDMWGVPEIIHSDNGKEFHSIGFEYGCREMGSSLRFRPPATPRFGGTIERHFGTLGREMRLLTGATYNDLIKKATTKPVHSAAFTKSHSEWDITRIIAKHHDTPHSRLNDMTPRRKWLQGLQLEGMIAPALPIVPEDLFIVDFLPWIPRKVSREGVQVDRRYYWDDALSTFVNKKEQKVIVRPDLRDVRKLWIQLPDSKRYIQVPMVKPIEFSGVTLADWIVFRSLNRRQLDNRDFHLDLQTESDRRAVDAVAQVRAKRRASKTELATRGLIAQNERFREQARRVRATAAPSSKAVPGQIDLSELEPTPGYVYRPKSPYT
ncbi:Mu transposase C-terminal domain-containing protein [Steroidobacter agaridevorans]|nr:Mu transposase C-terminal domain-containing protein [Steroidobacter agaridevorans]